MEIDDNEQTGRPMVYFSRADAQGVRLPHNDALVISAIVVNYTVQHIFVDLGNYVNIIFYKVYQQMKLGDIPLESVDTSLYLYGFAGNVVHLLGQIALPLFLGTEPNRKD
ncbi:UNVERIFIED_CONTAM: hypothetical protein Scaly_0003100 [Sesamum calycinum]|uniref:Uncharacterized protein n=1 Tax=Sesamum calycinum TaxID=2727403 RepID=A0AAW2STI9_9LAMI